MAEPLILAIDQGTTNTKALLVNRTGDIVARASAPVGVYCPHPAWVEQDAIELWRSVQSTVDACLAQVASPRLAAVAVSNQRESALIWERATGRPLGPSVTWQCRRTAPACEALAAAGLETKLHVATGLTIDPLFSATKLAWLLDHTPAGKPRAAAGEICYGTVDAWVLWNLTGGAVHACDASNAARTQLFNLHTQTWDPALLALFGLPAAGLPTVRPSSFVYGETAASGRLPGGVPVASLIGDSHAALFGHAGFQPGAVKATYGTGSSLMTPISAPMLSNHGLSTTVAWTRETTTFALEGNISVTGAAVQWLGDLLGHDDAAATVGELASRVPDSGGVYFVPALVGLGAPHWRADARGVICGLTRGSGAAHLARATLESIAFQVHDVFVAMQADAGRELAFLLADGGASRSDLLMQFQADLIDRPVLCSASADVSALGAAYLAGLAVGVWTTEDEIAAIVPPHDRFTPRLDASLRAAALAGWQDALARTLLP